MQFKDSVKMVYELLIANDPEFAEFVDNNENKTSEEIFKENNIDYSSSLFL